MSGLRAGQSMTSTPCWSKKAAVSRAVRGGALSWTYTKLRPNTPVAHGNIWFLRIWMYRCRFMAPSTTTSSLLPPWWIAPHTMTDGPRFPSLGWTQASISFSPYPRRTRINRVSSLKKQCLHCLRSHTLCHSPRPISGGQKPSPNGSNWHPPPNRRIICIRRWGAEMKRFVLTIRSSWRSSRGVEIFIEPPRFLWCGRPVSRLRHKILLMHPWDTPSILATSRWELPPADNLTVCCSICSGKFCGMIPFNSSKKYQ